MIRMYRQQVERALVGLLYLKRLGYDLRAAVDWATGYRDANPVVSQATYQATRDRELGQGKIDDLITELAAMCQLDRKFQQHDATLIDVMVEILQLPHARATLNGRVLKDMRKALLLPDELAGLNERLRQREMACQCGKKFESGEAITFRLDDSGAVLYCFRCARPDYVACDTAECNSIKGFYDVYGAKMEQRVDCGQHTQKVAPAPAPANPLRSRGLSADIFRTVIVPEPPTLSWTSMAPPEPEPLLDPPGWDYVEENEVGDDE